MSAAAGPAMERPEPASSAEVGHTAARSPLKLWLTLIRREFWEFRGLWMAPLFTAALIVIASFFGGPRGGAVNIVVDGEAAGFLAAVSGPQQLKFFSVFFGAIMVPQMVVALVVVFFYLLDALYAERKDRSILFWKSMPVSDASTVLTKAIVALLIVPLWVWVISVVVGLLAFGAVAIKVSGSAYAALATWHTLPWFAMQGMLLTNLLLAALWYAPIAALLLVVSAYARRAVFLWAVLPPLVLAFLERIAYGTTHVVDFIGHRLIGFFNSTGFLVPRGRVSAQDHQIAVITELYSKLSATSLLASADLWLGLLVAAALLYLAIRLRRYRDDT
jgi:ABC-2 type transport system permease protein